MSGRKKGILMLTGIFFLLCIALASVYLVRIIRYQERVKELTYTDIALEKIQDGIYIGECDADVIYAKVAVTVKDGAITRIDLIDHKNERGTPAEKILYEMLEQQSIDVELITGATNSSKVIKKAVEKALVQ